MAHACECECIFKATQPCKKTPCRWRHLQEALAACRLLVCTCLRAIRLQVLDSMCETGCCITPASFYGQLGGYHLESYRKYCRKRRDADTQPQHRICPCSPIQFATLPTFCASISSIFLCMLQEMTFVNTIGVLTWIVRTRDIHSCSRKSNHASVYCEPSSHYTPWETAATRKRQTGAVCMKPGVCDRAAT